ncbi:MAG: hypothetical protein AAFN10_24080 [Bacteroidota bacterium]
MKLLPTLTLISILLVIAWNYAVNAMPLNGITSGEVSALYPTLITPAGYAFSIWGIIYIGLLSFGIFQILPAAQNASDIALENRDFIRKMLLINMLGNALWLLAFHYQYIGASVLVMLSILGTLLLIHLRLSEAVFPAWVNWAFQIYFGWITVATVVNVSVLFYTLNIFDNSSTTWLIVMLIVAMLIGGWLMWNFKAYAYLGVLIWAFIAIGVKLNGDFPASTYAYWPWAMSGLMTMSIIIRLFRP